MEERLNIKRNLDILIKEIENAEKISITNEKVKLIAVTKTHGTDIIKEVLNYGIKDIGENKVQELKDKIDILGNEINYHMIGNLQSNKVKYIYDKVDLIHSLDRVSLAKEIDKRAKVSNIIVNCLVQVNIGKEKTKSGLYPEEVEKFIEEIIRFENIKVKGLMTIAPNSEDSKYLRSLFKQMFNLRELIKSKNYKEIDMNYLSMGMSNDYKIAIEEGANIVRVGSKIFGLRDYDKI